MSTKNFTEIDTEALKNRMLERMEERTGELLYPGDERRIFAEAIVYALSTELSAANERCKARTLDGASGYQLDALGKRYSCERVKSSPATVELKFSLATSRPNDITIPAGTTVTADNKVLFSTNESVRVAAGTLEVSGVIATATVGGSVTNGIPAGAIQSFVDKVPYVTGVVNTSVSSGGDDGEPYPVEIDPENGDDGSGDARYRERIRLAPAAFSAAGTESRYKYYAMSASANVEGCSVNSEQTAGTVDVYITEKGGADPSEGTLEKVRTTLQSPEVRALNDLVTVQAPEPVEYDIDITYYVLQAEESSSTNAIQGVDGAIDQYNAYQQAQIGRDINPDTLRSYVLGKCIRMDVRKPEYVSVSRSQIARFSGNMNVSYIVVEE